MALTDNLTAYWKLDESSGDAIDATGNGYTLTNSDGGGGSITYESGKINNGARNDGGKSRLFNTNIPGLTSTSNNTWNFWIKNTALGGYYADHNPSSDGVRFILYGSLDAFVMFANGNEVSTSTNPSNDTFYMITVTKSGTNWELFLNASSEGTTTTGGTTYTNNSDFALFNPNDSYNSEVNAVQDEFGYWQRTLSSSEITQLYNSGSGLEYPFLSTHVRPPGITGTGAFLIV